MFICFLATDTVWDSSRPNRICPSRRKSQRQLSAGKTQIEERYQLVQIKPACKLFYWSHGYESSDSAVTWTDRRIRVTTERCSVVLADLVTVVHGCSHVSLSSATRAGGGCPASCWNSKWLRTWKQPSPSSNKDVSSFTATLSEWLCIFTSIVSTCDGRTFCPWLGLRRACRSRDRHRPGTAGHKVSFVLFSKLMQLCPCCTFIFLDYFYSSCFVFFYICLCRSMEDFVTWVDSSKIKQHVLNYNDEVSRRVLFQHFMSDFSQHMKRQCHPGFSSFWFKHICWVSAASLLQRDDFDLLA